MRTLLVTALILVVSSTLAQATDMVNDDRSVVWGVTAGSPQLIALTLETHQDRSLRFQASLGTIILASSITGRLILTRISGSVRP